MAESNGCEKAFRSVTRGGADSTSSPEPAPSNMRDCVATMEPDFTLVERQGEIRKEKLEFGTTRRGLPAGEFRFSDFEFRLCQLFFCGFGLGRGVGVLFLEALNAARGVDKFLLAGEEGMAVRADFHAHHFALDRRARLKRAAASAMHGHGVIVRVNTGFHGGTFRRVRSAQPSRVKQDPTAASLGRETIFNHTRRVKFRKMG